MNFSTDWNHIMKYTGSMRQFGGIKRYTLDEGFGRGVKASDIWNADGLEFSVLWDRGMDIGRASYRGVPISFISSAGDFPNPSFYSDHECDWLRSYGGGLLTGSGMRNCGAPSSYDGEKFGLHGRLSNTPAYNCSSVEEWRDGRYILEVSGTMRESAFFGENLLLQRKISTELDGNYISIQDSVENQAAHDTHIMMLYHINIGYPILSENSFLKAVHHKAEARDEDAARGLEQWCNFHAPVENYREQCFYHDIPADNDGFCRISIVNPDLKMELEVAYRKSELPCFTQWKQLGTGAYVLGLEPGNCHVGGVEKEHESGALKILKPAEKINFHVKISIRRFTDL